MPKWTEGLRVKNKEHKRMGRPSGLLNSMLITVLEYSQSRSRSREVFKPSKVQLCGTRTCKANERTQEEVFSMSISSNQVLSPKNPEWEKEKQEICKNYTIVQATTKVPQVIGKNNIKDIGK